MNDETIDGALFAQDVVLALLATKSGINLDELQQVADDFVQPRPSGEIDLKEAREQRVRRAASLRISSMLAMARDMQKMLDFPAES